MTFSLGFTPGLELFGEIQEAEAAKDEGVSVERFGFATTEIVCRDRLCHADYLDYIDKPEIETQCREGQILVFRTIHNDYVCTSRSTAVTWVQLDMALIVDVDTKELVGIWDEPEQMQIVDANYMEGIDKHEIETQCMTGQVLVFLTIDNDYVCTSRSTAVTWIQRSIALLVDVDAKELGIWEEPEQMSMIEEKSANGTILPKDEIIEETMIPEEDKEQMIPLPVVITNYMERIDKPEIETQCREGQILVFRTIHNDYVCTIQSTAVTWVKLDMALIVDVDTKELVGIWEEPKESIMECEEGLQLIFKFTDNSPACVKLVTKQKLIIRGWASNV